MAGRGGKRPGAGRKTNAQRAAEHEARMASMTPDQRADVETWTGLLNSENPHVVLRAMIYLTDRVYGKPRRSVTSEIKTRGRLSLVLADTCSRAKSKQAKESKGGVCKPTT